jgi:hypothetical protein
VWGACGTRRDWSPVNLGQRREIRKASHLVRGTEEVRARARVACVRQSSGCGIGGAEAFCARAGGDDGLERPG